MKMIYLQRNKKIQHTKSFQTVILTILFIGIVVLISYVTPSFFPSLFTTIAKPIWGNENAFGRYVSNVTQFFTSKDSLIKENETLKQDLLQAQLNLTLLATITDENYKLKGFTPDEENSSDNILAGVLVRPPRTLYDTIIVDRGVDKGIVVGQQVYGEGNTVLGVVTEVLPTTSKIKLLSSSGVVTPAIVERTNASVDLLGMNNGNFEIHVPQDLDIVSGDVVVFPGLHTAIAARVLDVESSPKSSFKTVLAKSTVNIRELRWVLLGK